MKRLAPLLLLVVTLSVILTPLLAATAAPATKPAAGRSPALALAGTISTVTGIAISPLLGTGAYGAYQWIVAKDDAARAKLPWFSQPKF